MFSQAKAKIILGEKHPTLHGKPITKKQRGLLGLIAGNKIPTRMKKLKRKRKKGKGRKHN